MSTPNPSGTPTQRVTQPIPDPPNPKRWYKRFAGKKMAWVLGALIVTLGLSILVGWLINREEFFTAGKGLVFVGLAVAAVGQLVESASKSSEAESNPEFKDGLELVGEGTKFYGVLATLLGAIFAVDV